MLGFTNTWFSGVVSKTASDKRSTVDDGVNARQIEHSEMPGFGSRPAVGDKVAFWRSPFGWVSGHWKSNRRPDLENEGDAVFYGHGSKITLTQTGILIDSSDHLKINISGTVTLNVQGDVSVQAEKISLNGNGGEIVTTQSICSYTGAPHPVGCSSVRAG